MPRQQKKTNPKGSRGFIRIIGGLHRGRKLPVLDHEGLRPTTDRVKETLFNWLMLSIREAEVLDMFSGSGALGFEAYSRGASKVTMIELDREVYNNLEKCKETLGNPEKIQLINGNSLEKIKHLNHKFDIIFLDPPFRHDILSQAVPLVVDYVVHNGTLIYLEQEIESTIELPSGFIKLKEGKAGQVNYRLFRYDSSNTQSPNANGASNE